MWQNRSHNTSQPRYACWVFPKQQCCVRVFPESGQIDLITRNYSTNCVTEHAGKDQGASDDARPPVAFSYAPGRNAEYFTSPLFTFILLHS